MRQVRFSPAAQADLSEIYDYTAKRWDTSQAERYVLDIRDACHQLAADERRGRPIDDVKPGYLKLAVVSHFLFFRLTDTHLDVVRILHQRMDVPSHL